MIMLQISFQKTHFYSTFTPLNFLVNYFNILLFIDYQGKLI